MSEPIPESDALLDAYIALTSKHAGLLTDLVKLRDEMRAHLVESPPIDPEADCETAWLDRLTALIEGSGK